MGAWGIGFFENDTACDWGYSLDDVEDLSLINQTFDSVLSVGDEYLESPEAEEALAAAEVVARLQGNWGPRDAYTEMVDKWVERVQLDIPDDVVQKARAVVDRVSTSPSELFELFQESDEIETWKSFLEELKERVGPCR